MNLEQRMAWRFWLLVCEHEKALMEIERLRAENASLQGLLAPPAVEEEVPCIS